MSHICQIRVVALCAGMLLFAVGCAGGDDKDLKASAGYQLQVAGPLTCLLYGNDGTIRCRGLYNEIGAEGVQELPFGPASSFGLGSFANGVCAVVGGSIECLDDADSVVQTLEGVSDATLVRPPYVVRESGQVARIPEELACCSLEEVEGLVDVVDIASINQTACALHANGTVTCLGDKESWTVLETDRLQGVDDVIALSASKFNYCALRRSGSLVCWGAPNSGAETLHEPTQAFDHVDRVGAGMLHQCLEQDQEVWCWGSLDETDTFGETPERIAGIPNPITEIDGGWYHTCVLTDDKRVYCVGDDDFSQSGAGDSTQFIEAVGF